MSDKARKVADCAFSKALLSHKNASASLPPRRAHSQRAITRTSCERTKLEVRCFRMGETRTSLVDLLWVTGEDPHRGAEEKASAQGLSARKVKLCAFKRERWAAARGAETVKSREKGSKSRLKADKEASVCEFAATTNLWIALCCRKHSSGSG